MPRKSAGNGTRRFKAKDRSEKVRLKLPSSLSEEVVEFSTPEPKKHNWKWIGWVVLGGILVLGMSFMVSGWIYVRAFLKTANISVSELALAIRAGVNQNVFGVDRRLTFLLLGLDRTANRSGGALLTDSIMLMSVGQNGQIGIVSIPRDLWLKDLQTKINALYYYGEAEKPGGGGDKVKAAVEEVTGVPVDYVLLMEPKVMAQGIDSIGGIEVPVVSGFVDDKYPRDDVDLTAATSEQLYKRVEFATGSGLMSGERAVEYSRSRMSSDMTQGNDGARQQRQQAVFEAWIKKLKSPDMAFDPAAYGRMYRWWKDNLGQEIPDWVMVALANQLKSKSWEFKSITLTDKPASSTTDLLAVPPIEKYGLWVYEPIDPSWKEIREFIGQELTQMEEVN